MALLVRHGKTPTTGKELPGHAAGLHLADEGRAQAERAAERIAALERRPVAVYASPLERTRETAAPIARALGLRVRTEHGLIDSDTGDWTGSRLSRVARKPEWARVARWPAGFRFPGGESFAEVAARANDTMVRLAAAHPGGTFVAVSHADTIKLLVATAAGVPLDLFQRIVISPCSVSALAFFAGGPPVVLCVNSTATLSELAIS
ncbi:MAG TPA: histidine phosphatase family protein [Acidimicrobiales bacterium]|nr:histidine phosphatase family protein [Acidimicrobiales bacterium]